ncbi:MAG TPA: thermonuclease family protein [Rhizomicrobium sp.]
MDWRIPAFVAAALTCTGAQASAPPCAGEVEIGDAPVVRVEHNDVLILRDGRALHLEGVRLPHAARDRAPQAVEDQTYDALNALAKNQDVMAHAVWPKQDRYDRVRAQVFTKNGTWLQTELLRRGLARVEIAPDRGECYRELYDAEGVARAARLGLWSLPAYAIRTPETLKADVGTFQIVFGKVLSADKRDGRVFLNFGPDWKTDFTVTISPDDMKTFRRMGVDPLDYQDKLIRVRGIVQWFNGPEIEIGNPKQIELLQ